MTEAREAPVQDKPKKEKMNNVPTREGPAGIGKTSWKMWGSTFCIDDRYTPIKVRLDIFLLEKVCYCVTAKLQQCWIAAPEWPGDLCSSLTVSSAAKFCCLILSSET